MNLDFCWTLRLFYLTLSHAMQISVQILQISTTRTSMATNFSSKLVIPECCSVTEHKLYQKLPRILFFCVLMEITYFPNLRISLQILLTIAVSIASCERSFSKLKFILSYLRASMGQDPIVSAILLFLGLKEKHWKQQISIP